MFGRCSPDKKRIQMKLKLKPTLKFKNPILDSRERYFTNLGLNVSIGTILMLALVSATLVDYPNDMAKAQQTEAFILLGTYRQDFTVSYIESLQWPAKKRLDNSSDDYNYGYSDNHYVKKIIFDGKGGLHATFSDQVVKALRGKTLSFVASTNPPHYTRIIWNCGNSDLLPDFIALSENKTDISTDLLTNQCKSLNKS